MHVDVSVIGLGVVGSAVARSCARRGLVTVGYDRSPADGVSGASGGESKILRTVELGGMPDDGLGAESRAQWDALGARHPGVLRVLGGWVLGEADNPLLLGAIAHARREPEEFEICSGATLAARLPFADLEPGTVGVHDLRAAVVDPHAAVMALRSEARAAGAQLVFDAEVVPEEVPGETVVLAMGVDLPATPVTGIRAEHFVEIRLSTDAALGDALLMWPHTEGLYAVVPSLRRGADTKIVCAIGQSEPSTDAQTERERQTALAWLGARCPRSPLTVRETAPCAYAWTDSEAPVIERTGRFLVAATCCGRGFKSAPHLGDQIADWIASGTRPASLASYRSRDQRA